MPPKRNGMSIAAIEQLITQRVADALLTYEANRNSGNGNRNGNGNGNGNGNRNGNENDNGNGSHDSKGGNERPLHTACACTYTECLNCQPLNFKGTEGAVELAHWFEKIEYVFHISNCAVECQVKCATCTLLGGAVTWWNSYVRTVGHDVAYEILMDQKVRVDAARQDDNKKRMENNLKDNHTQQPPYTRQNVARTYTVGPSEKKEYVETLPLCNKCKLHHNGPCTIKYANYKEGHYRSESPRLRNQNYGNLTGNGEARGRVYVLGGGEANQDPDVVINYTDA
nr:reverse transcriptase domain-containing protein [Tanacetum cinerariifolium]